MTLDRRLHAFRPDLAEMPLEGLVEAPRFVPGEPARILVPNVPLRPRPDPAAGTDTELLLGEGVRIFDSANGWAWIKSDLDSYVGYIPVSAVGPSPPPSHWVSVPRTFVYAEPDMKKAPLRALSLGSRIAVAGEAETRGTRYLLLADGGAIVVRHAVAVGTPISEDFVAVAARLVETPYLWGGRSAFGLDCSGLVQLSMMMTGRQVMRDSDQQAASLGSEIAGDDLRRGDLVFWKGHVAIMEDAATMIHANGFTMTVARETLADAIDRIAPMYGLPTLYRRP